MNNENQTNDVTEVWRPEQDVSAQAEISKKRQRSLVRALIIAGVIILLLSGWVAYLLMTGDDSTKSEQASQTDTSGETVLQPSVVTDKVREMLAADYTILDLDKNNQPKSGEVSVRLTEGSPVYKVDGYDYYVDYAGGSSLQIATEQSYSGDSLPTPMDVELREAIAAMYVDLGLTKSGTRGSVEISAETEVYTGVGLICTIESPTSMTSASEVSCGSLSEYPAVAAVAEPIVATYPHLTSSSAFTGVAIKNSAVAGYQSATLGVYEVDGYVGALAMFYKKDSGDWKFFKGVQSVLACTSYNTNDIRNAFNGEVCEKLVDEATGTYEPSKVE